MKSFAQQDSIIMTQADSLEDGRWMSVDLSTHIQKQNKTCIYQYSILPWVEDKAANHMALARRLECEDKNRRAKLGNPTSIP